MIYLSNIWLFYFEYFSCLYSKSYCPINDGLFHLILGNILRTHAWGTKYICVTSNVIVNSNNVTIKLCNELYNII